MKSLTETRAAWLKQLLATDPADRGRAEASVRRLYAAAGFAEPQHMLWYDSPFAASWAVALLVAPHHFLWAQKLASSGLTRDDRQRSASARSALGSQLGLADWDRLLATIGAPLGMHLQFPPVPSRMLSPKLVSARLSLSSDVSALFTHHGDDDDLARAEGHFWGSNRGALRSALHCPTTDSIIGNSFAEDYSFSTMADDEHRVSDREAPPIMRASWDAGRSAGMWWPFQNAAILSDRPAELHVNERHLLHNAAGPAVVYRDGWRVYAWNGKAVPEQWIMHPDAVPPREYKGFDPTFKKHVDALGKPQKATKPAKPVGGRLPMFERYQAGAHVQVWQELVAFGAQVREAPHAADALAVAHETMRRVHANVRTLIERLTAMGYSFNADASGRDAGRASAQRIFQFEKEFGSLPLSLRAFYEVVGEVNLIGSHPAIDPKGNAVATDPLVVYGLDDGLVEYDADGDDEEDKPSAILIAPDDLHKANTSGGDPYEIAIPDARADGELLNERHKLFFVDYLRLCFRFGGFPGYEGIDKVPAEIGRLSRGLIEF